MHCRLSEFCHFNLVIFLYLRLIFQLFFPDLELANFSHLLFVEKSKKASKQIYVRHYVLPFKMIHQFKLLLSIYCLFRKL